MKFWLILTVIVTFTLLSIFGLRMYKQLNNSLLAEVKEGPGNASIVENNSVETSNTAHISSLLKDAGLNQSPVLGDTGISGHLQRLQSNTTDLHELQQYALDLEYLNQHTSGEMGHIPTSFWDVRTAEMLKTHWTEYSLVHQLAQPSWQSYLHLLAKAFHRFQLFKAAEIQGNDSALDAALDMFALVEDYYHSVPVADLIEHQKEIKGETESVLMIWQSVVAGTTRVNPLTHKPLFSHSIFARNNVGTMYQYAQGQKMSIGTVWGVSGFAPRYVGTPKNNNQVEHMSISIVLQLVMHEPVLVLDAVEEEKLLLRHANAEESHADMALNNAIHKEFKPRFSDNHLHAVEHLRSVLHSK